MARRARRWPRSKKSAPRKKIFAYVTLITFRGRRDCYVYAQASNELVGSGGMKNQLKILTTAALMAIALYSTQAFASVGDTVHSNATIAAAAAHNMQVADGYYMPPTDPDDPCDG
jgi:hypothetical protein